MYITDNENLDFQLYLKTRASLIKRIDIARGRGREVRCVRACGGGGAAC